MRVPPVDNHIARFEEGDQLFDKVVDRLPRFDEEHHLARTFERSAKFFDRMCRNEILALAASVNEFVDLRHCTVENGYRKAFTLHIEYEVFAHHGETYQSDIC